MLRSIPTFRPLGRALAGLAALVALSLATGPAVAQDQQPQAQGQQPPAQEQAQPRVQVQQQPEAQPQNTLGPKFQDWQILCQSTEPPTCGAVQEVKTEDGRLALWTAFGFFQPNKPMIMLLRLPYGLTEPPASFRIAPGITLSIDGRKIADLKYEVCGPAICTSGMLLSDQLIGGLKAGAQLTVSVQLANGAKADMAVSLAGFTASFAELTKGR